jgi:hypothetical protein
MKVNMSILLVLFSFYSYAENTSTGENSKMSEEAKATLQAKIGYNSIFINNKPEGEKSFGIGSTGFGVMHFSRGGGSALLQPRGDKVVTDVIFQKEDKIAVRYSGDIREIGIVTDSEFEEFKVNLKIEMLKLSDYERSCILRTEYTDPGFIDEILIVRDNYRSVAQLNRYSSFLGSGDNNYALQVGHKSARSLVEKLLDIKECRENEYEKSVESYVSNVARAITNYFMGNSQTPTYESIKSGSTPE